MSADEMSRVEDERAQRDLGVLAVRVYAGAREEARTAREAFWATVALLVAMIAKPAEPAEPE